MKAIDPLLENHLRLHLAAVLISTKDLVAIIKHASAQETAAEPIGPSLLALILHACFDVARATVAGLVVFTIAWLVLTAFGATVDVWAPVALLTGAFGVGVSAWRCGNNLGIREVG